MLRLHLSALVLAVSVFAAAPARAAGEADALFRQGRELLEKSRWAEACSKLQESERLAPAVGTLLNLGYCWEQLGRMRSAMDAYAEAEILAGDANDAKSATFARERFNEVEAKVMKLVVRVEEGDSTPGLAVTKNGRLLPKTDWGKPIAVDPEDVALAATAPGRVPWRSVVSVKAEGTQVTIVVPPLVKDPTATRVLGIGGQRVAALGFGGAALAAIGGGTSLAITADSVGESNVATGLFVGAAFLAGMGLYLWLTGAPEPTAVRAALPRIP